MKHFFTKLLHVRTALLLTAVLTLTAQTARADSWPEYITDVVLVGGTESEAQSAKSGYSGYTWCSKSLNDGTSGDVIYIGYKTGNSANTNGGYITDFIVVDAVDHNPPSTISCNGHTYYLCPADGADYFANSNHGNLTSQAANGWNIYLYYTKEHFSDKRAVSSIAINDTKSGAIDCYKKDGTLLEENISLNRGVKNTPYVYMHIYTETKVNRPYPEPTTISGLTYDGTSHQLIPSNYDSDYSGDVYFRLGTTGSYTDVVNSITATNAGTYTIYYYSGESYYGNSSVDYAHTISVTIAKSPNNGVTVSCSNYLEGTKPVPSLGGTNLSTGTVTYKFSTSQDGTYTNTVPTEPGTYWVKATIAADNNCYEYTTAPVSFTITYNWKLHNSGDTEDDAYVISTTTDLKYLAIWVNVGNNFEGKFFKLGDNIAFDKSKENNFTPIGNSTYSFTGTFDGKGYTISGLNINKPNNDNVGLFGNTEKATIKNLIVDNSTITGKASTGAIVGHSGNFVTVTNCRVTNSVTVSGTSQVGGITGVSSTVSGCVSAAAVSGSSFVGGIIGNGNFSSIANNLYTGTSINCPDIYKGAIVGEINGYTTLTANYYTADLSYKASANNNDINGACRAVVINTVDGVTVTPTGDATVYNVSGITAYTDNSGMLYSDGTTETLYAGATETVSLDIAYDIEGFSLTGYTDGNGNTLTHVSDNTYTLTMTADAPTVTPVGSDLWGVTTAGRDGSTADKAYRITTPEGLNLLAKKVNGIDGYEAKNYSGKYFELGDDITYNGSENNYTAIGTISHPFSGTFDGKGHTVSGIRIDKNERYQAIFGYITGATVKNLTVDDTRINIGSSTFTAGGILGLSEVDVIIENCHATSSVIISGAGTIGGIAGNSNGTIRGCTSAATVSGNTYIGGIAGKINNSGSTTENNLVLGATVSGSEYAGAIVGYYDFGTLTNNRYTSATTVNGAAGSDQDGATVAYEFPDDIQDIIDALGTEGTTYGTGDYTGITAYQNGLKYNGKLYYTSLWTGNGYTASDPYVIYTPEGLDRLAELVNSASTGVGNFYALGHDIAYDKTALTLDLDGQDGADSNFPGIGDYDKGNYFYGSFDGRGHTISGIVINRPSIDNVGLFADIFSNQSVENLTLANSDITGHDYVGAIAGYCGRDRTIQNCHVASDVTVTGHDYLGGIVGGSACVLGSTSAANVTGRYMVGGVIGMGDYSTIRDCLYFGNSVTATSPSKYVGAIAGCGNNATVEDNYHTCYGHGAVGANQSATGSDTNGAQFAVSSTSKPATFGDATATYGTGSYTGITAYGTNGLLYNGRYYWHDDDLMVIDNDGTTNTTAINAAYNKTRNVVLSGRTLYKDGGWNTLCLPFELGNMSADSGHYFDGTPLEGAEVRKLMSAGIEGSTLTLTFNDPSVVEVNLILAGTPYIVKWPSGEDVKNPVFTGVKIYNDKHDFTTGSGDTKVQFIGTYDKVTFEELNRSILFVGAENTLYYPDGSDVTTIGACRAYFKIGDGANARQITDFDFNFDGGETTSLTENKRETITNNQWYTLDGRKLDSKPTQKGVYINNGRKVVVK